jgi:hypothetical protein
MVLSMALFGNVGSGPSPDVAPLCVQGASEASEVNSDSHRGL